MPTRQAVERDRLELLAALERDHAEGPDWQTRFAPGTFGCHEALHLASVLASMVDEHLAEHPAIVLNARWFELACRASAVLAELYQEIGRIHLQPSRSADNVR